jgi:hypothetical protein
VLLWNKPSDALLSLGALAGIAVVFFVASAVSSAMERLADGRAGAASGSSASSGAASAPSGAGAPKDGGGPALAPPPPAQPDLTTAMQRVHLARADPLCEAVPLADAGLPLAPCATCACAAASAASRPSLSVGEDVVVVDKPPAASPATA